MAVVVSAPGKVLLTGGYLILERPNAGIVLSTDARFFAIVKPIHDKPKLKSEPEPDTWAWTWSDVKLSSPQLSRQTAYKLSLKELFLQPVTPTDPRNPFVELAVQYSVATAHAIFDDDEKDDLNKLLLRGLDITILGSNEFYSFRGQIEARGLPLTADTLAALPRFAPITFNDSEGGNNQPEVAKTGLGSSAAMTASVTAALLQYLGVTTLSPKKRDDSLDFELVHAISQTVHCVAQGKVGSGFDVSAAVYGSQRYVRFTPEVLAAATRERRKPLPKTVAEILNQDWDHERTGFCLPPMMTLMLGEPGVGGSSTPSMVSAVKKWQNADPDKSAETWRGLSEANSALERQLSVLSCHAKDHLDAYKHVIESCSVVRPEKWAELVTDDDPVMEALLGAREAMLRIRCRMKEMGEAVCIPIEPDSQTRLLDSTMEMEGVLLAGVPGAGGFDAVFAVSLGNSSGQVAGAWRSHNVLAFSVKEDPRGLCLEQGDPRAEGITSAVGSVRIE